MNTPSGKAFKALVVKDHEFFRDAMVDELAFYGFQSSTALDGEEELKGAVNSNFCLIRRIYGRVLALVTHRGCDTRPL